MIKQFFKKVLISYLIIICCIYTPTAQAAGFSFGGYNFGNGSLNITKNGVKITTAAVDSAPITSNLGAKILGGALRGASVLSAISLMVGIAEDAIDWVLDPENNQIKYKSTQSSSGYVITFGDITTKPHATKQAACEEVGLLMYGADWLQRVGSVYPVASGCKFKYNSSSVGIWLTDTTTKEGTIPIPTVAQKVFDIAKSGNTSAQADVTSAVNELVNTGTYDTPINQAIQEAIDNGTIPKDDTANPTKPEIDTSSITAAIQSLASAFASAISNGFNGITSVINTSIDKLLNKQDQIQGELVNTGTKIDAVGGKVVGVGDKVDAVGGKVVGVGEEVKDVGGKVVGLNDSVDKVGDKVVGVGDKVTGVGDKVDAAGDKVGTKVDAVGEKVTGVGDKVVGVGDKVTAAGDKVGSKVDSVGEKVTTVGDKVTTVGDKVDAAGEKTAEAIKESTKEITKKMDEAKPKDFELPAFCDWAKPVCDFIDWVKKDDTSDTDVDVNVPQTQTIDTDINFGGSCPANITGSFVIGGRTTTFNIMDWSQFCLIMSTYLKPLVVALASYQAVKILAGRNESN